MSQPEGKVQGPFWQLKAATATLKSVVLLPTAAGDVAGVDPYLSRATVSVESLEDNDFPLGLVEGDRSGNSGALAPSGDILTAKIIQLLSNAVLPALLNLTPSIGGETKHV